MVAQDVHRVLPVPTGAAVVLEAGLWQIRNTQISAISYSIYMVSDSFHSLTWNGMLSHASRSMTLKISNVPFLKTVQHWVFCTKKTKKDPRTKIETILYPGF